MASSVRTGSAAGRRIVGPPAPERDAGLGERGQECLIPQLIPQAAVEPFDEAVLHGFGGAM